MAQIKIPIQVNGLEALRDVMDRVGIPTDTEKSDEYLAGYRDCWRGIRRVVGELMGIEEDKTE